MTVMQRFRLPLLAKELIEQAQKRRTYILRVAYAVVLYGIALAFYGDLSRGGTAAELSNLGRGRAFFNSLIIVQLFAIIFLVPSITCGALTIEKEKDTLALLLLTKLSPWTIVFEKLLSRVIAMGTYQLLSLPLFAIIYGIGGVELPHLIVAIISLMGLTAIVASISILCSTWFRTTSEAFIMAYVILACLGCFMAPFIIAYRDSPPPPTGPWRGSVSEFDGLVFLAFVIGVGASSVSFALLYIASKILVIRAFVPPRNVLLELFQRADRFFNELNRKTTGGIILVPDRETLPLFRPITWRETRKKSLGTFRYQFRILMVLLAPLLLAIAAVLTTDLSTDFTSPFRGFPVFFWLVSVICLTIHSTGVIPAERIRQTLDVLLVAPLLPSEIVLEKLSGVRRLIKILTIPFAVLVAFQAIWTGYVVGGAAMSKSPDFWRELVSTSLTAIVYMPLIMWVGFQWGLRSRTQIQAVLLTFASILTVCVSPFFLAYFVSSYDAMVTTSRSSFDGRIESILVWFSPLQLILGVGNPDGNSRRYSTNPNLATPESVDYGAWMVLLMHFTVYGIVWWRLRENALRAFSRIVGRVEPDNRTSNG